MKVLEQHHDLEEVRALLGHARIDTRQVYTSIRPPQLKRGVVFTKPSGGPARPGHYTNNTLAISQ